MAGAAPRPRVLAAHADAVDAAYRRSGASRWDVPAETFAEAVHAAIARRFGTEPDLAAPAAVEAFVSALHAEDLGLALACAAGHGAAWDHFVLTYRPELYRAARAIAGDASARELADSLYAELFGLPGAEGARRSLLTYYHGRSRLGTWLRSVLAQRHVDAVRAARRTTSLDDPDHVVAEPAAAPAAPPDVSRRLAVAAQCVSEAIAALEPGVRLRLSYYYVHDVTLAETGRLFGEHEATASRKLEKARQTLRAGIEAALARRGLHSRDVESWSDVAREAWDAALADALGVEAPARGGGTQAPGRTPFKGKRTP